MCFETAHLHHIAEVVEVDVTIDVTLRRLLESVGPNVRADQIGARAAAVIARVHLCHREGLL